MQMVKATLFFLIGVVFTACMQPTIPGFTLTDSGLYYKIHAIGDNNQKIKLTDYLTAYLTIENNKGDTLFSQGSPVTFQVKQNKGIDFLLQEFNGDDSISILVDHNHINFHKSFIDFFLNNDSSEQWLVNLRIIDVRNKDQFRLDSLNYFNNALLNEKLNLDEYLRLNKIDTTFRRDQLYFIPLVEVNNGKPLEKGHSIRLSYVARFLDGRIFDATSNWNEEFVIEYGRPMQLISGLDNALSWMNEGEVAKIILPSQLAFGKTGSPAGNVPPYTAVTFELKLVEIY